MSTNVVPCSVPGCDSDAASKLAAPWSYGRFQELKTYGYACPAHQDSMIEYAENRPKPSLDQGETLGEVGRYDL